MVQVHMLKPAVTFGGSARGSWYNQDRNLHRWRVLGRDTV